MVKKVLSVIRTSTIRQEIESQRVDMLKFLSYKGYKPNEIEWLISPGASARSLNKKYLDMLETIKQKTSGDDGIKCVAGFNLNRLGRVETKLIEMKEWFIKNKVQLLVENPDFSLFSKDGTVNPAADLTFSIFAVTVKFETSEMFAKMQRGKKLAKSEGKYIGGFLPFGFKLDSNNYIVVDESKVHIIKHLYELLISGASCIRMRDYVRSFGYNFLSTSMWRMLKRDIYKLGCQVCAHNSIQFFG